MLQTLLACRPSHGTDKYPSDKHSRVVAISEDLQIEIKSGHTLKTDKDSNLLERDAASVEST